MSSSALSTFTSQWKATAVTGGQLKVNIPPENPVKKSRRCVRLEFQVENSYTRTLKKKLNAPLPSESENAIGKAVKLYEKDKR